MRLQHAALDELRRRVLVEIDDGNIPSAQIAFGLNGEIVVHETLGDASEGARYNMWSSTKAVVAAVMWQLLGDGLLDLNAPVRSWWPEFAANGKGAITVEHLLVHTAGIPTQNLDLTRAGDRALRVATMEAWELEWEPGSSFEYHGLSAYWVMRELVERTTGDDLRVVLRQRVLDPLGLDRLELGVRRERQRDIQPIVGGGEPATAAEIEDFLGIAVELEPPDDSLLRKIEEPAAREVGVPGGGGVSDAASVALFYQALLHNTDGLWDPSILKDATSNPRNKLRNATGLPAWRSIGLEIAGDGRGSRFRIGSGAVHPAVFGHGGACGQIAWADPTSGVSFAFYTNGVDRNAVREWRRSYDVNALAVRVVA